MRIVVAGLFTVVLFTLCVSDTQSCSTFFLTKRLVFGKNYDWNVDDGLLIVNKRGVSKVAMTGGDPAFWTSRYGSITFNQYGRELPSGGMNEAGLVVELSWLDETTYPTPDDRLSIGNLQWIQYQLDNAATVDEVIVSDADIRVSASSTAKIHYLVADRGGRCASVEFVGGRMVCHTGGNMPVAVLTNNTYELSVGFFFHDGESMETDASSLGRFVAAARRVSAYDMKVNAVDYAFETLGLVSQGEFTKWRIVYNIGAATVYFRTSRAAERKHLSMRNLDFACDTPVMVFDLNADASGNIKEKLQPYSRETNRRFIGVAFAHTSFLKNVPQQTLDRLAGYPESTDCASPDSQ